MSYCCRLWCSPFLRYEQIIVRHKTGGYWEHANTGESTGYTAYPLVFELSFIDDLFSLQACPRSTSESTSDLLPGSLYTCTHVFIVRCSLARRHVQESILALEAWEPSLNMTVHLGDICMKPYNNFCAVMTPFGYFQNNRTRLHEVKYDDSGFFPQTDYIDHFTACIKCAQILV